MEKSQVEVKGIKKIKKVCLRDQIVAQIKDEILMNRWQPGHTIVIDKLATEMGISHTPIREALAALELEGMVELVSYTTPRVAIITPRDINEIYEMRILVEAWAIIRAAITLTDDQINELECLLEHARQRAFEGDYSAHLKADLQLHETILRSTGNSLFEYLAQRVHDQSIRVRFLVETTGTQQDVIEIIDEHCRMVEALHTRNPDLARDKLIFHLKSGLKRTVSALERVNQFNNLGEII
jgi:DNA-binding GntR family transcriptional regulator